MSAAASTRQRAPRPAWIVAVAVGAAALGHLSAGARAGGEGAGAPLVYTGVLEEGEKGVTGTRSIGVALHDAAVGGDKRCAAGPEDVSVVAGRFAVALGEACTQAVREGSELWIEVEVEGQVLVPRTRIAAVPYALEADRTAAATGPLREELEALKLELDALKEHVTAPEGPACPAGYTQSTQVTPHRVCTRAGDEVVRVGAGPSTFWIDRYEASVWEKPDGTGLRYFEESDNDAGILGVLPKSGVWIATPGEVLPAHAVSKRGVIPSRYITWFQAAAVCRASGKRLPTSEEWQTAAAGTPDPGESNGNTSRCYTKKDDLSQNQGPRPTGGAQAPSAQPCISRWGAEDLIGNLWEWTQEWYTGLGAQDPITPAQPWPPNQGYGDGLDATWNIESATWVHLTKTPGLPAASQRGGNFFQSGAMAGVFALALDSSPASWWPGTGFRCVIPR